MKYTVINSLQLRQSALFLEHLSESATMYNSLMHTPANRHKKKSKQYDSFMFGTFSL